MNITNECKETYTIKNDNKTIYVSKTSSFYGDIMSNNHVLSQEKWYVDPGM